MFNPVELLAQDHEALKTRLAKCEAILTKIRNASFRDSRGERNGFYGEEVFEEIDAALGIAKPSIKEMG